MAITPLRARMIEDMNARKLGSSTQRGHIHSCKRFAGFLNRSPDTATAEDIRRFQLHLAEAGLSICNRNRIMTGLRFLFRVTLRRLDLAAEIYHLREPQRIPLVMSRDEARRLLAVASKLKVADIGVVQIAGERRRAARRNREQNPGRAASQPIRQPSTERSPTRRLPRVIPRLDHVPMSSPVTSFTPKQGQYLAFIYAYTRVLGRPPAEADLQKHFGVSPPSVHQMVLTLERAGLIRRQPGVARSIEVVVPPELLPILR
jgi:hypothetical protein